MTDQAAEALSLADTFEARIRDACSAVRRITAEVLCVEPDWLDPTRLLADAPNSDSLDIVELQMALEDSLHVELPDEVMAKVSTFGELTSAVVHALAS